MADQSDFIQDVRAGLSPAELVAKHGLSPAVVAARIRWAREHGKLDPTLQEAPPAPDAVTESTALHTQEMGAQDPPISAPAPVRRIKTRAEIMALIGSPTDNSIRRQLAVAVHKRIKAYEAEHGKNANYRLAMDQWAKQERLHALGLTVNDMRRLRGIIPDGQ